MRLPESFNAARGIKMTEQAKLAELRQFVLDIHEAAEVNHKDPVTWAMVKAGVGRYSEIIVEKIDELVAKEVDRVLH